jgi:hypothetical protein
MKSVKRGGAQKEEFEELADRIVLEIVAIARRNGEVTPETIRDAVFSREKYVLLREVFEELPARFIGTAGNP